MTRMMRRLRRTNVIGLGFIAVLVLVWEVSVRTGAVQAFGLPPFSRVTAALFQLMASGELLAVLGPSLQRWAIGYTAAIVVGTMLGMVMAYFRLFHQLLEPATEFVRPIPSPAYVPVAILFLGIDDAMKIFVIAFASLFPIMINTYSGVRGIDAVQMDTARTFGVSRTTTIIHVILPAAAPFIFTGMRVSLAVSLIVTVMAEMIAGNSGIGYFILFAQRTFVVDQMYAGIIALGLLGYALNRLFVVIEASVLSWHLGTSGRSSQ